MSKTCLITGANSGIGFATALGLAKLNFRIVMLCRDKTKGAKAREELIKRSGSNQIELMLADLSSQNSIRDFAKLFNNTYSKLDILINCAGANFFKRELSKDGIEMTLAVNFLGPFLLTNLLMDTIIAGAPARIINVVAESHRNANINFYDLQFNKDYNAVKASSQAMLARVIFTYELARRLIEKNVTANCFHPGAVKTNLQKKLPFLLKLLVFPVRPFFLSSEKGAEPAIFLASDPKMEGLSGGYFNKMKQAKSSPLSYDRSIANRLWEVSAKLTNVENK